MSIFVNLLARPLRWPMKTPTEGDGGAADGIKSAMAAPGGIVNTGACVVMAASSWTCGTGPSGSAATTRASWWTGCSSDGASHHAPHGAPPAAAPHRSPLEHTCSCSADGGSGVSLLRVDSPPPSTVAAVAVSAASASITLHGAAGCSCSSGTSLASSATCVGACIGLLPWE